MIPPSHTIHGFPAGTNPLDPNPQLRIPGFGHIQIQRLVLKSQIFRKPQPRRSFPDFPLPFSKIPGVSLGGKAAFLGFSWNPASPGRWELEDSRCQRMLLLFLEPQPGLGAELVPNPRHPSLRPTTTSKQCVARDPWERPQNSSKTFSGLSQPLESSWGDLGMEKEGQGGLHPFLPWKMG